MEKDTDVLDDSNTGSSLPQGLESAVKTNHFALSPGYRLKDFTNTKILSYYFVPQTQLP